MSIKKSNFMISTIMIVGLSLTNINAEDNGQSQFNAAADQMTYQELKGQDKEKVKKYFEYRKSLINNIQCPVITKEFLNEHKNNITPIGFGQTGFGGIIPVHRRGDAHAKTPHQIVNLDNINWTVMIRGSKDWYTEALSHSGDIRGTKRVGNVSAILDNPHDFLVCNYKISGDSSIKLYVMDEYLKQG